MSIGGGIVRSMATVSGVVKDHITTSAYTCSMHFEHGRDIPGHVYVQASKDKFLIALRSVRKSFENVLCFFFLWNGMGEFYTWGVDTVSVLTVYPFV